MKRHLLLITVITLAFTGLSRAQLSYTFSAISGPYTSNAGPTTLISSGVDDGLSPVTNIGFNFEYECQTYTQFKASSNGWMTFNTSITGTNLTNNLSTSSDRPMIAPLWDDLAVGASGNVNYRVTGTAPNRVCTIEWRDMEWRYTASSPCISFQVKLYETTNVIEFVYQQNATAPTSPSASIGLSGTPSGVFYSLGDASTSPPVSTVTETTTISTKPATGQIYRWTPSGASCSGTPTGGSASSSPGSTNCASTAITLSLTGASGGCGITYQWQSSPDNIVWTNIPGATSASYPTSNTTNTYYRCVVTCTNSSLSSNSSSVLVNFVGTAPANDLPCNAIGLSLGTPAAGDNTCSGNASEPAAPGCWFAGNINTVWYSFVAPASGLVKIKTVPVSSGTPLQNTQIAVYSGTCGSLALVACNDDAPSCGTYTQYNSELSLTGLTPGNTYFVVVDGYGNNVGQFQILAIDGTGNFPLVPGQDCSLAFPVCNQTMTIGNPGYQVIGGQCDHTGSSNCTSGEANSVWYTINIGAAGVLEFDIIPNDFGNPNPITAQANPGYSFAGDETDYDWVLWKIGGSGATTCAAIMSSGGGSAAACNFSYLGVTGCSASGNTPAAYGPPDFDAAYEVAPACSPGDVFILVVQNYSNSTSGFSLDFPPGSPVVFTPTNTYYWSGGALNSQWTNSINWGGCGTPDCAHDAVVTSASSFQPILTAGTYNARDVTINPGATLTIQSGATLRICGNLTNNGSLVCQPGATIEFVGIGVQNVTGSFTGTDGFHHLLVTKASGSVFLNNNIDIKGNFTTSSATSIFNTNNMYVKLAGNFANNAGNATYIVGATGTLEFNGTALQNYNQGSANLNLNFVLMNNTGAGVNLQTNMRIRNTTGTLTFTLGKITTNAFNVFVINATPACVTPGNNNSYVNGNLYRNVLVAGGTYDFPVGTAALYERARIVLSANTYTQLQSRFDPWPVGPNTQGGSECAVTYSLPSEDMGYWTINQTGTNTGTYNMTLYCNGATNTAPANAWTVEKAASVAGPWILNGTCVASTATVVNRNGMSGFSVFAAAQAPTPLPVQLTIFDGHPENKINVLNWTTESEVNNDYFMLEKSADGINYFDMARVEGNGNSNQIHNYVVNDESPFLTTYYRLRQVDYNGDFVHYGPIVISNNNIDELAIHNIYPNPADESFFIDAYSSNAIDAELYMFDSFGRVVQTKLVTIDGQTTIEIHSAEWASGIYIVKIVHEATGFMYISRIVIE